jgi:hypothetical protein
MSDKAKKSYRCCEVCGAQLIKDYYYTGRCALHQTTKDPDDKLSAAAVAAKRRGLSYGQYMAALREGRA